MPKERFKLIFDQGAKFISDDWKDKHASLLSAEHWSLIGERIFSFLFEGKCYQAVLPVFEDEIITEPYQHYQHFERLKSILNEPENEKIRLVAKVIGATPIESLLIVLGQRRTSATIVDENGIPPSKENLLACSFKPYNDKMSKAARARDKHISRNKDRSFWGEIEGTPKEKEETTKAIMRKVIEEKTWWNVFTHYKHDAVYEIRVASGEGIRWRKEDLELIGFLEPFMK